jgi:hypothetical protein
MLFAHEIARPHQKPTIKNRRMGLRRLEVKCIPDIRVTGKHYYEKQVITILL